MKTLLLTVLLHLSLTSLAQEIYNTGLKLQLDTILKSDQGIREFMDIEVAQSRKDTLAVVLNYPREMLEKNPWLIMKKIDSVNVHKVEQIIATYGYPGKTMVGEPENTAVFYVIQHSNKISKYYPLIENAGKSGELPFKYAAMMLDRKLSEEGKEQLYGTQVFMQTIKNSETGKMEPFEYVVPIKDPKNVNRRRRQAGFDSTARKTLFSLALLTRLIPWQKSRPLQRKIFLDNISKHEVISHSHLIT